MASSDFWQRLSSSLALSAEWESGVSGGPTRSTRGTVKLWVFLDVLTVLIAAAVATIFNFHATAIDDVRGIWHGTLIYGRSMWTLLALVCGFAFTLVVTSRRMHLYTPARLTNFLHEQRLSAQACFTSGLLLTGTLYLVHGHDIPRSIVITTVLLVTVALGTRRLVYRVLLYRRFDRGLDTRNVLIRRHWTGGPGASPPSRQHQASGIHLQRLHRASRFGLPPADSAERRRRYARFPLPERPQAVCRRDLFCRAL